MDIKTLLQSLLEHKVQFLVIGAWALPAYGYERMTRDIDILINPTDENIQNTMKALKKTGYDIDELEYKELFKTKKILFRQYILHTDIHPFATGITFEDVWESKVETTIKGIKVFIPSLDALIQMKSAAGREKDKLDLLFLQEVQKRKNDIAQ